MHSLNGTIEQLEEEIMSLGGLQSVVFQKERGVSTRVSTIHSSSYYLFDDDGDIC